MAWHATLLREHRDLRERLCDDPEVDVVADLHDARLLAVAHIGDAAAEHVEIRCRPVESLLRAGHDDAELAGADDLRIAADGRREER